MLKPSSMSLTDFLDEVKAIAATGYDLYVGHEFMPQGDAIAALQQAYAVMDVSFEACSTTKDQ